MWQLLAIRHRKSYVASPLRASPSLHWGRERKEARTITATVDRAALKLCCFFFLSCLYSFWHSAKQGTAEQRHSRHWTFPWDSA